MQIPHDAAVLVCDGEKLLWLRNEGDADYPNLEVEGKRKDDNPPDRFHHCLRARAGPGHRQGFRLRIALSLHGGFFSGADAAGQPQEDIL